MDNQLFESVKAKRPFWKLDIIHQRHLTTQFSITFSIHLTHFYPVCINFSDVPTFIPQVKIFP
jgi:hypothetical protein